MSWLSMLHGGGQRVIELTISADTNNYNIRSAAGQPTDPVLVIVTVEAGVTVGNQIATNPAMRTNSSWNSKSRIRIINNGIIAGSGGAGGDGGAEESASIEGQDGAPGSDALEIDQDIYVEIDNQNGEINGGGGGGGGGDAVNTTFGSAGGGGGGGRSGGPFSSGGSGGNSTSCTPGNGLQGTSSSAGSGGSGCNDGDDGGDGGDWATAGQGSDAFNDRGAGGAPGKAIELNGNSVTWINMGTVNGAVS